MPVPSGLVVHEIGAMGHSNVGTYIQHYRTLSSRDLIPLINHGSADARVWGEPTDPGYAAAWAKIDDDEPVGGFRAFWVMLGFLNNYSETPTQQQAWATHIFDRLMVDHPTIEWIWWSPMNTYFETNPGDGDAFDLVAIDRWGANPQALDEWVGAVPIIGSEQSWLLCEYAVAQGYADDYGPWINLTEDITDVDGRHPTQEPGDPEPNGQTHGGEILRDFFDISLIDHLVGAVRLGTIT